MLIIKEIHII